MVEVPISKELGPVFVKPEEVKETFGPGVSVPGATGTTTTGEVIGGRTVGEISRTGSVTEAIRRTGGGRITRRKGTTLAEDLAREARARAEKQATIQAQIQAKELAEERAEGLRISREQSRLAGERAAAKRTIVGQLAPSERREALGPVFLRPGEREAVPTPATTFKIRERAAAIKEFATAPLKIPLVVGRGGAIPITTITTGLKEAEEVPLVIRGAAEVTERAVGTPLRLLTTGVLVGGLSLAPAALRLGAGLVTTGLGTREFVIAETPVGKVAGLITAGLGLAGTTFEAVPFVKGAVTRVSPRFKPVRAGEVEIAGQRVQAKFIEDLKFDGGAGQIGLIPEAIGRGPGQFPPGAGALERGGFGFKPSEQIRGFGGRELRLTTSQRGLIEEAGQFKAKPEISELGFFFTPADPITGIPQTRVSRLGLQELFKRPRGDISLGIARGGKPQIIVTEPTPIVAKGPTGFRGEARIAPKGSTELEVTALANIEVIGDIGTTVIKGQRVDIISGRLTGRPVTRPGAKVGRPRIGEVISTTPPKTTTPIFSLTPPTTGIGRVTSGIAPSTRIISKGLGISIPTIGVITPRVPTAGVPTTGIPTFELPPTGGIPSRGISPAIPTFGIPTAVIPEIPTLFERPELAKRRILRRKSDGKKKKKKPTKKFKRRKIKIAPSFTSIVAELTGGLPEEVEIGGVDLGILPTKLRRL